MLVQGSSDLQQFIGTLQRSDKSEPSQQLCYAKITSLRASRTGSSGGARLHEPGIDPNDTANLPVNCMCIWARPSKHVTDVVCDTQRRLQQHLGEALYAIPVSDLHLSVVEFSHRHEQSVLEQVQQQLGSQLLQRMLNLPTSIRQTPDGRKSPIFLVKPRLCFDKAGIALTFVPDASRPCEQTDQPVITYHHLRNELHKLALLTGTKIDTCYTAATAHITIARFVREPFSPDTGRLEKATAYLQLIEGINDELEKMVWPELMWDLEDGLGLELQMGYLKFGRERDLATIVK